MNTTSHIFPKVQFCQPMKKPACLHSGESDCRSEQKMPKPLSSYSVLPIYPVYQPFCYFWSNYLFTVSSRYEFETSFIHMQGFVLGRGIQQRRGQTFCLPSKKLLSDGNLTENQNNRISKRHCLVNPARSFSLTPFSDCFYLPPFKLPWQKDFLSCLSMQKYTVSLRGNFIILVQILFILK